jgi:hypothetical protein
MSACDRWHVVPSVSDAVTERSRAVHKALQSRGNSLVSDVATSCVVTCSHRPRPVNVVFEWETGVPIRRIEEVSHPMAYYAPTATRSRPGVSIILLVYLVIGAIVAATHHYWSQLHTMKQIGSALLATVLWPLVLIGINLHIH